MKSKCCNVGVGVFTSKERTSYYVCGKCKEACDVACEPVTEPKFVGRWQGEDSEDSLEMAFTAKAPRLTPEQWAKVRWPDWSEVPDEDFHITQNVIDWAIRYALQDLKPERDELLEATSALPTRALRKENERLWQQINGTMSTLIVNEEYRAMEREREIARLTAEVEKLSAGPKVWHDQYLACEAENQQLKARVEKLDRWKEGFVKWLIEVQPYLDQYTSQSLIEQFEEDK